MFTAFAILQLVERNQLSLDDSAHAHVPEVAHMVHDTADAASITVRHLLTHTAGLSRLGPLSYVDGPPATSEKLRSSIRGYGVARAAGVAREYSNLGYALLGLVIEHVAATTFRDFVGREILSPLGMKATTWEPPTSMPVAVGYRFAGDRFVPQRPWDMGQQAAAGGLYSNIGDLARFMAFQLSAWPPRGGDDPGPLSRASVRESHRMVSYGGLRATQRRVDGGGLGWMVVQDCNFDHIVWHNGETEGFRSAMVLLPPSRGGLGAVGQPSRCGSRCIDVALARPIITVAGICTTGTDTRRCSYRCRRQRCRLDQSLAAPGLRQGVLVEYA